MSQTLRRIAASTLAVALLFTTACETSRPLGACIGLNGVPNPKLRYEYSVQNVVIGLVFSETIVVPVVVAMTELQCPAGPAVAPAAVRVDTLGVGR
jgi:hypothetical protein